MTDRSTKQFCHVFSKETPGHIQDFYVFEKKPLGEGSFGTVMKGTAKGSGAVRAIKEILISKVKDPARFEAENDIQRHLDHPNIVKLYEVFKDAKKYYLVMELCTGGELFDRIIDEAEKSGRHGVAFSETRASTYMMQIMRAINYMHTKHYVHRDIKPENFLMQSKDPDAEIKVIDFGGAKYNPDHADMTTKAGTHYYVAPQVLAGKYDEKCDIWSCGVVAYILLCGYPPFFGARDADILRMVKKGKFDFPSPDWDGRTAASKSFITSMLTLDPGARPSAQALLEHEWLLKVASSAAPFALHHEMLDKLKVFNSSSKMKKLALTVIAQEMKDSDLAELKKEFQALDQNGDGTLEPEEIKQVVANMKTADGSSFDAAAFSDILFKLDTDGSGKVDWSEFMAAMISRKDYIEESVMWRAFMKFDLDGDGQITKAELKQLISDQDGDEDAIELTKSVEAMIEEGDLDKDGMISFEEFKELLEK